MVCTQVCNGWNTSEESMERFREMIKLLSKVMFYILRSPVVGLENVHHVSSLPAVGIDVLRNLLSS